MEAVAQKIPLTLAERDAAPEILRVPATLEEYWELSELTEYNIEYVHGEIVSMGQATPTHESLIMRFGLLLNAHFDAFEPYQVLGSNVKIFIEACVASFNADFSVVSGKPDYYRLPSGRLSTVVIKNPELIGEVLSDTTKAYDLDTKLRCYKTIPSLRYVLFVDQSQPYVTTYTRTGTPDEWLNHDYRSLDDTVRLGSVELPMREIYRKIQFAAGV